MSLSSVNEPASRSAHLAYGDGVASQCLYGGRCVTIYTPADIANMQNPQTVPDAIAKAGYAFVCRSAPYLAGWALVTGNIPAAAGAAAIDVACGLPLIPIPNRPPPFTRPAVGGERPVLYNVVATLSASDGGCNRKPLIVQRAQVMGPVERVLSFVSTQPVSCRPDRIPMMAPGFQWAGGGAAGMGSFMFPDLGDWFTVVCTPVDGSSDSPSYPPIPFPTLPPGTQLPPGYPDNPQLPGWETDRPIYRDPSNPDQPTDWLPIKIPPIPLPVIIPIRPTVNVPINAPISIPVTFPLTFSPSISGQVTFQLDKDGNLRDEEDHICECPEKLPPGANCPDTSVVELPYYECGNDAGFKVATLEAVSSSIPSGLFEKLLSSSNLAEVGCEVTGGGDVVPSMIANGVFSQNLVEPWYSGELPDGVVSVELRIISFPEKDLNELSVFPGASQYKFGSICFCRVSSEAASQPVWVWDKKTYAVIPREGGKYRVRLLLKPGVQWQLWDTGER
jgi:hypothetical protein